MKCNHCGFECEQNYTHCPQCQTELQVASPTQKILGALTDPLFLILCILMTASCMLSLISGSLPLIHILITVFLWLTYSQSKKGIADSKRLRCVSGAVYAKYILNYISAGLVLAMGVLFAIFFGAIAKNPSYLETLLSNYIDMDFSAVSDILSWIPSGLILIVCAIIAAFIVVFNIFSMRYIHRFVQSIYQSNDKNTLALKHVAPAKLWMFIIGGFNILGLLTDTANSDFLVTLSSAANGGVGIIAGLLVHKHFSDPQ